MYFFVQTLLLSFSVTSSCAFLSTMPSLAASRAVNMAAATKLLSSPTVVSPLTGSTVDDNLVSTLKKPSKTLAVVMEVDPSKLDVCGLATLSMQLRKLGTAAFITSDLAAASEIASEQSSAAGSFPGPCPVIYNAVEGGRSEDEIAEAIDAGVSAIVSSPGFPPFEGIGTIYKIDSIEQVSASLGNAFLVDSDIQSVGGILASIPAGSVVLASVKSMQKDNAELSLCRSLKDMGVTAVVMEKAIVGDNEDLEYSSFLISGLTKKKSSSFNMSGLTGSANGHFGGVASNIPTTWLRPTRQ